MSTYVAVFALVLSYVALVASYIALRTLAKLRRASTLLSRGLRGPDAKQSLLEAVQAHVEVTAAVAEEVQQLRGYVDGMQAALTTQLQQAIAAQETDEAGALRSVALVRYDAFTDMSGRLSFSLALLDERGNGVAISAIAGLTDTRVYAKGVMDGKGEHELSPEERQAVEAALLKRRSLIGRRAS
jgi:hypothetical protein